VLSGNFANINWASGPFFVKTETDVNGGSNYTITNTTQLLSVPYALYANNTSSSVSASGDTLFIGNLSYIIPGISAANNGGGGQSGITAHSCGADSVHNPAKTYGTMTDQQGNVYKTILIGTQEWMAENLKTSIYRNGESIAANLTNTGEWENTINTQIGAWVFYNNNSQFDCPYGKLYNWYAVADPRNLCPTGWHVPTDVEWTTLTDYLGGLNVAGGKMKSTGTQYWLSPNTGATNESGFSGLPGGTCVSFGSFYTIGTNMFLWSSSESDTSAATRYILRWDSNGVIQSNIDKNNGFSVRCLRD
jgi:uncharacterized protein (TIGR02145 family)